MCGRVCAMPGLLIRPILRMAPSGVAWHMPSFGSSTVPSTARQALIRAAPLAVASFKAHPIFSAVTYHAGQVAAHIDDGISHLFMAAAHEPDHGSRGGRSSGYTASAGGGQLAGEFLNIHIDGMGYGQRLYQMLFVKSQDTWAVFHYGQYGGKAVVAAACAAHDCIGTATHAAFRAAGHKGHNTAHKGVSHNIGPAVFCQGGGGSDAKFVLHAVIGQGRVHPGSVFHEGQFLRGTAFDQGYNLRNGHGGQLFMESRPAGKGVFLLKERRENSVYCPGCADNIGVGVSYCAGQGLSDSYR